MGMTTSDCPTITNTTDGRATAILRGLRAFGVDRSVDILDLTVAMGFPTVDVVAPAVDQLVDAGLVARSTSDWRSIRAV